MEVADLPPDLRRFCEPQRVRHVPKANSQEDGVHGPRLKVVTSLDSLTRAKERCTCCGLLKHKMHPCRHCYNRPNRVQARKALDHMASVPWPSPVQRKTHRDQHSAVTVHCGSSVLGSSADDSLHGTKVEAVDASTSPFAAKVAKERQLTLAQLHEAAGGVYANSTTHKQICQNLEIIVRRPPVTNSQRSKISLDSAVGSPAAADSCPPYNQGTSPPLTHCNGGLVQRDLSSAIGAAMHLAFQLMCDGHHGEAAVVTELATIARESALNFSMVSRSD